MTIGAASTRWDSASDGHFHLFGDEPVSEEGDEFGHASYAEVLANALRAARPPLTIGLLGPWGIGKSTVLRQMKERLTESGDLVVVFDAWRYDGEGLRRQLLRAVGDAANQRQVVDTGQFNVESRLDDFRVDRQTTKIRTRPSWGGVLIAALQAAVLTACLLGLLQVHAMQDALNRLKIENGVPLTLSVSLITFVTSLVSQVFRVVPETTTRRRLDDSEAYQATFRDLVRAIRVPRLVIAVDNLDRTPARDALDLLSTIKTFLEPAASAARLDGSRAADVLFVIAVDEHGLRRHLTSSGDVAEDADEYLRKIFTASIRLAPLLPDDLRGYVSLKLSQVRNHLGVSDQELRSLTTLVAGAFHSSPRQVLQFVNTLQLRISLIRAREVGGNATIRGGVSLQPLAVAKMALIQDRWPQHYEALRSRPHLLDTWHAKARGERHETSSFTHEWETLAPFLRLSEFVVIDSVRPFVALKQTEEERTLADYSAFRSAAIRSDRRDVATVMDENPTESARYAVSAARLYREELDASNVEAARAVLDVILTNSTLARELDEGLGALLASGLAAPGFQDQLRFVPAEPLLRAAMTAKAATAEAVVSEIAKRLGEGSDSRALEAAQALAMVDGPWTPGVTRRVREALPALPLEGRASVVAAVVGARVDFTDMAFSVRVSDFVIASPAILIRGASAPEWRSTVSHLIRRGAEGAQRSFASVVVEALVLAIQASEESAIDGLLAIAEDAVASGVDWTGISMSPLAEAIPDVSEPHAERTAAFVWDRAEESGDAVAVAAAAMASAGARGPSLRQQSALRLAGLPGPLIEATVAALTDVASTSTGLPRELAAAVIRDSQPSQLPRIAALWALAGSSAAEVEGLMRPGVVGSAPEFDSALVKRLKDTSGTEALDWLSLAVSNGGRTAPLLDAMGEAFTRVFQGLDPAGPALGRVEEATRLAVESGLASSAMSPLLRPVFEDVEESVLFGGLADVLCEVQQHLSEEQRGMVRRGFLSRAVQDPSAGELWRRRFESLDTFASDSERDDAADVVAGALRSLPPTTIERWLLDYAVSFLGAAPMVRLLVLEFSVSGVLDEHGRALRKDAADALHRVLLRGPDADDVATLKRLMAGPVPVVSLRSTIHGPRGVAPILERLTTGDYATWDGSAYKITERGRLVAEALGVS